ncbi:SigE family RNA polymerase sigma factor [Nocardioides sp. W7]|uniref:SigE family RNA polymerase sigma factor n=1 Tax=Nocardioides sp. W7 TaxID=2931390 RepID=UPI001FD37AB3|nr:SigE family RNA polymerase sigma factor [Nocardioides sp. W7]
MSESEFTRFYLTSRDRCLRAVVASGLRPDEAEEAVAEAFARAWSHWGKVRTLERPEAWVVRTAVNATISSWRRRRREAPTATPPDGVQADAADRTDLMTALHRLPPRQRDVVVLRYLLDLSTQQTADHLGIAPGTVASQLHKAIATLRSHLTHSERTQS